MRSILCFPRLSLSLKCNSGTSYLTESCANDLDYLRWEAFCFFYVCVAKVKQKQQQQKNGKRTHIPTPRDRDKGRADTEQNGVVCCQRERERTGELLLAKPKATTTTFQDCKNMKKEQKTKRKNNNKKSSKEEKCETKNCIEIENRTKFSVALSTKSEEEEKWTKEMFNKIIAST